jgi:hypothetical protein
MSIEITLKNYRCFPLARPARFVLNTGATALLGRNNAGKSALLRFFYELRPTFSSLLDNGDFGILLKGGDVPIQAQGLTDLSSIFSNTNGSQHDD